MFLQEALGLSVPLIQAPMAGVSTPALAAAVSQAGGLGSLGLGAASADSAGDMIDQLRQRTDRPFNVNLFTHAPAQRDAKKEADWLAFLGPQFAAFDAAPPTSLQSLYKSFNDDAEMVRLILDKAPRVVSFHFGLPAADILSALKARGILTFITVTSPQEARAAKAAGIDVLVAQGIEAGGHRGIFDPEGPDSALPAMPLTRLLVKTADMPVVAAGGIMDGAGIAAMLDIGAVAAQLGTAFIACPESAADGGYRSALSGLGAYNTVMTDLISGRPARALENRFTALASALGSHRPPDYPVAYDAGKALHAVAKARGEDGFGAHWAGQGAPLARSLPAADLVALLSAELQSARDAAIGHSIGQGPGAKQPSGDRRKFRRYVTVDVFTDEIFRGNPVAVILDAEGLTTAQMQAVAREFNYVETTFVLPPDDPAHTARVRIFTPVREIPFAGHPNIGTAFALALEAEETGGEIAGDMVFEEDAGLVRVSVSRRDGRIDGAKLTCPEAFSRRSHLTPEQVAPCLDLAPEDIDTKLHPPVVASVGLPFLIVHLRSRDALRRAGFNRQAYAHVMPLDGAHAIYAYTSERQTGDEDADLQARMFTAFGAEDPATGSATSAASALLAHLQSLSALKLRVRQGVDMGRPSTLTTEVFSNADGRLVVNLGGQCTTMMRGEVRIR